MEDEEEPINSIIETFDKEADLEEYYSAPEEGVVGRMIKLDEIPEL